MSEPRITVVPGGPYVVTGAVPLRRRRAVETELGEPITWQSTGDIDPGSDDGSYALCRCGGSSNKPFCDGTHKKREWDSTETAPTDSYAERAKAYPGTGVTVHDDRGRCEHAGFCTTKVTNVWKMTRAAQDTAVRSQLMAMVERCPSGALTYTVPGAEGDVEPALPVAIGVVTDGPLAVTGGVPVERADGQPMQARNRMTLCRCGHSANKPLCDGSHIKVGFTG